MKEVTVEIEPRDGEGYSTTRFTVEVDRGAGWTEKEKKISTEAEHDFSFNMMPGERLVVEPYPPAAVAFDEEQYAAYVVKNQKRPGEIDSPLDPEMTPQEKQKLEAEEERISREAGETPEQLAERKKKREEKEKADKEERERFKLEEERRKMGAIGGYSPITGEPLYRQPPPLRKDALPKGQQPSQFPAQSPKPPSPNPQPPQNPGPRGNELRPGPKDDPNPGLTSSKELKDRK